MRVVVTGVSGYIGRSLSRFLLDRGCQVIALVREASPFAVDPRMRLLEWPPRDGTSRSYLSATDVVVHLASPSLAACERAPDSAFEAHLTDTNELLARFRPRERFIYLSSCSVFGYQAVPVDEDSRPTPVNAYGLMKLAAEQEVLAHTHPFPTLVLRLASVYGVGESVRSDLLLNRYVGQAVSGKPLCVAGPDLWRGFIHIADVVRALSQIMDCSPCTARELLCVGDPQLVMTLEQIGRAVASRIPGTRISLVPANADKRSYRVNLSRMRRRYGIEPTVTLSEGLMGLVRHFQAQEVPR